MKKLLLGLTLLNCANVLAFLPEDQARIDKLRAELRACEDKMEALLKENARIAQDIAVTESKAAVNEAQSKKKAIPADA